VDAATSETGTGFAGAKLSKILPPIAFVPVVSDKGTLALLAAVRMTKEESLRYKDKGGQGRSPH